MTRLIVIQNIQHETAGLFETVARNMQIDILHICPYKGDAIFLPSRDDIILILGGPMGVSDLLDPKYPWLLKEIELIRYCLSNRIAYIGVCLGAQLLSIAAGGKVITMYDDDNNEAPEIGWSKIFTTNQTDRLAGLNLQSYVLHWHADRAILSDIRATILYSSHKCKEQLFKVHENAFGVQFHTEIDELMVEKWLVKDEEFIVKGIGATGKREIWSDTQKYLELSKEWRYEFIKFIYKELTFE